MSRVSTKVFKQALKILSLCTHEIPEPDYPKIVLEECQRQLGTALSHLGALDEQGKAVFLEVSGDAALIEGYNRFEHEDPFKPPNAPLITPVSHMYMNIDQFRQNRLDIIYEYSLVKRCTDFVGTLDSLGNILLSVWHADGEPCTPEKRLLQQLVGRQVIEGYLHHAEMRKLQGIADLSVDLVRQAFGFPFVLTGLNGDVVLIDEELQALFQRDRQTVKGLVREYGAVRQRYLDGQAREEVTILYSRYLFCAKPIHHRAGTLVVFGLLGYSDPWSRLSRREQEVTYHLLHGKRNGEIAALLCISEETVKRHLVNTFAKLAVRNRVELVNKLRSRHP